MTEFQTTDDNRITIQDIARHILLLDDLADQHLADPRIQRILHKLQDGTGFRPGDAQGQIEAAYYQNEDWVDRILAIQSDFEWEERVLRECRAATLDELGEAWRNSKDTPQADLIAMVIREKADLDQSHPVHFNEPTPCILSVNNPNPYPCKLSASKNKMHGVLRGNSYDSNEREGEVLNTPCIEARIGGFNAAGVIVPSEPEGQQVQSRGNGAGAIPTNKNQHSQQASIIGNGAARARKARTHKPIAHAHLKMASDFRSYGLREIHLQLWRNGLGSGQALFTGKLEYKRANSDETRFQYCDFQSQRKFRATLNKPKTRPGRYTKGEPKRFIDEPWYTELNQYLLHQNQLREEHGLPALLVSHSQHTQRSKKGNIVWVHREDRRVLLLFRDTKGNPHKLQMLDGRFAIDFPVLNTDISAGNASADYRATWYRQ